MLSVTVMSTLVVPNADISLLAAVHALPVMHPGWIGDEISNVFIHATLTDPRRGLRTPFSNRSLLSMVAAVAISLFTTLLKAATVELLVFSSYWYCHGVSFTVSVGKCLT